MHHGIVAIPPLVKESIKLIEDAMKFQELKATRMTGVCLLLLAYFDE